MPKILVSVFILLLTCNTNAMEIKSAIKSEDGATYTLSIRTHLPKTDTAKDGRIYFTLSKNKKTIKKWNEAAPRGCANDDVKLKLSPLKQKENLCAWFVKSNPGSFCGLESMAFDTSYFHVITLNRKTMQIKSQAFTGKYLGIKYKDNLPGISYTKHFQHAPLNPDDLREIMLLKTGKILEARASLKKVKTFYKSTPCQYEKYLLALKENGGIDGNSFFDGNVNEKYLNFSKFLQSLVDTCAAKNPVIDGVST